MKPLISAVLFTVAQLLASNVSAAVWSDEFDAHQEADLADMCSAALQVSESRITGKLESGSVSSTTRPNAIKVFREFSGASRLITAAMTQQGISEAERAVRAEPFVRRFNQYLSTGRGADVFDTANKCVSVATKLGARTFKDSSEMAAVVVAGTRAADERLQALEASLASPSAIGWSRSTPSPAPAAVPVPSNVTTGTAFIVAPGLLLTSAQVVRNARELGVANPATGEKARAHLVAVDESLGLALVSANVSGPALPMAGADESRSGSKVFTLGYPQAAARDFNQSVTYGTVQPSVPGSRQHGLLVDMQLNRGNSGGPVLSTAGRVVSVVSDRLSTSRSTADAGRSLVDAGTSTDTASMRKFLENNGVISANFKFWGDLPALTRVVAPAVFVIFNEQ